MQSVFSRIKIGSVALLLVLAACETAHDPVEERARYAQDGTGDIVIGAAWPWEARGATSLYSDGMDLAVETINAHGGVLGRPLRLLRIDDMESVNQGRVVAQTLADNPEVVAVIGHLQSYVTIPAATIYENGGLVMVSPFSTSPKLTRQGHQRVFRTTFNDEQVGRQMAVLAHRRGFERVAILYMRNTYGRDLANAFEKRAKELGVNVIERQSYTAAADRMKTSFGTVLRSWSDLEIDAIFLAAAVPEAGVFITQARAAGIAAPVLGGDAMDSANLIEVGGADAEGTIVASNFHIDDPRPVVQQFVEVFEEKTGTPPNRSAASGYDAVQVLAHAIEQAGSAHPDQIAHALHTMPPWEGATGVMAFDERGDLANDMLIAKVVRNGDFEYFELLADSKTLSATDLTVASE